MTFITLLSLVLQQAHEEHPSANAAITKTKAIFFKGQDPVQPPSREE